VMKNNSIKPLMMSVSLTLMSCGPALELQQFSAATGQEKGDQQEFQVEILPLNFAAVDTLNASPFIRDVSRVSSLHGADRVSEAQILSQNAPPVGGPQAYRIGNGDMLSLVLVGAKSVQPSQSNALSGGEIDLTSLSTIQAQPTLLTSPSQVDPEGSVLFLETGKLNLGGLTLKEAEAVVGDALIRNNVDPLFQLVVTEFASQWVTLSVPADTDSSGTSSRIPITTQAMTLRDLLAEGGVAVNNDSLLVAHLNRSGRTYSVPVMKVFDATAADYFVQSGDVVVVEAMEYAPMNAYLSVSSGSPVIFPLEAGERPTLSDMLFVEGGPLSERTARLSEIYLLRGQNPIKAYHLDAGDVTRLAVAGQTELRPGDIVFVADKPVYTAIELLNVLNPFRVAYENVR